MQRTIAVVTTSRADYGHLFWVLRGLEADPRIDLRILVLGAQLSEEFGRAEEEIRADGFRIDRRIECLISSDTDVGMAKTIGVAVLGLADALGEMRPDLLLLIADRYEMLAPASVALSLRIPIAHIEGGEVSQGAIDDAVRNALTKMSHLHFTCCESARRRVLALGEESWRVHMTGSPSLDHLRLQEMIPRERLEPELGVDLSSPPILVAYHPVTLARDTLREAGALFQMLERVEQPVHFCFPNSDAGSRELIRRAREFCDRHDGSRLWVNLHPVTYWSLLHHVSLLLGNSSSGIMETASLELPTVNIGMRQQGRERAANVIDTPAEAEAILDAVRRGLSTSFRASLRGMTNPYGDGRAAERIARVLAECPVNEELLIKRPVAPDPVPRQPA